MPKRKGSATAVNAGNKPWMQVTAEPRRIRWRGLVTIWLVIAALAWMHTAAFATYVHRVDALGRRGAASVPTPLQRVCPTGFADTEQWVRHALALADGAGPQLRHIDTDNAPDGREVHWDTGFAWALLGAGWLQHAITGAPLAHAVEQALAWFNLPLLVGTIVLFSAWTARRAGVAAGAIVASLLYANPDFYVGFAPNYVDHHGVLAAAVFGLVLGAVFMGLGFVRQSGGAAELLPESLALARTGATTSAVCGAIGMWVSAATAIPAILITGGAAGLVLLVFGRGAARGGAGFAPQLWRWWGAVGAVLSFAFYLLEYAPGHLGWRLEANHPLYAIAWWGGGELIAQIGEGRAAPGGRSRTNVVRLLVAVVAVALAPAVILLGGDRVFVVFDPFIARLSAYVAEGLSFAETIRAFGWRSVVAKLPWAVATVLAAIVLLRRAGPANRIPALFAILSTAAFCALGFAQARWWSSASGAVVTLILLAFIKLNAAARPAGRRRFVATATITAVVLCGPTVIGRTCTQIAANRQGWVAPDDALQPLYRDLAAQIRRAQPAGDVILLASPNASAGIAYYGEFKSVGTLYWENLAGTKAAAGMFSTEDDMEARRLMRRRGITHVVMLSDTNFLAEYYDLLHPAATAAELAKSFGYQLLVRQEVPVWLEPLPYNPPTDLPLRGLRVLVFATRFSDPRAETQYESAVPDIEAGRLAAGEAKVDAALAIAPKSAEFWLIKAHLLLARGEVNAALRAVANAIGCAGPTQVYLICTAEAVRLYQAGAQAAAADLYRRAASVQPTFEVLNNLVWILATSRDAAVRNGTEALEIAERVARDDPDYLALSAYAAALAECHRYDDAATTAERAVAVARESGNVALLKKAEACLAAYRHRTAWRE